MGGIVNKAILLYYILIKQYERLKIEPSLPNGRFLVFFKYHAGEKQIIKVPRRDSKAGRQLLGKLRNPKEKRTYRSVLKYIEMGRIGAHICHAIEVYKNGSYSMEYVKGCNLLELFNDLLLGRTPIQNTILLDIIAAIEVFICNLKSYVKENDYITFLVGDWGLYNILYDEYKKKIVNVDLEGFYLYKSETGANNIQLLKTQLRQLQDMIRIHTLDDANSTNIKKALTTLNYVKTSNSAYSAKHYAPGYHSIELGDYYFRGQRECKKRLLSTGLDFNNKTVLDIGCNTGGMIHALADKISVGVGIDYDARCINAANLIKQLNNKPNINFFTFDLEKENLNLIRNLILADKIDICLLLSICIWIKNWKEVIKFTAEISDILIFESNGLLYQQNAQVNALKGTYKTVKLINPTSDDDILNSNCQLYLCQN